MSNETKVPKPETKRAYLISAGYKKPQYTVHYHYQTKPEVLPGAFGGAVWVHYYQCFRTGAVRKWGYEERLSVVPEDTNEKLGDLISLTEEFGGYEAERDAQEAVTESVTEPESDPEPEDN